MDERIQKHANLQDKDNPKFAYPLEKFLANHKMGIQINLYVS